LEDRWRWLLENCADWHEFLVMAEIKMDAILMLRRYMNGRHILCDQR